MARSIRTGDEIVDSFSGGNKFDLKGIEFVNDFQKVLRAPRQSVKSGDEKVEIASTNGLTKRST
jgi:hypothetical protein